MPYLWWKTDKNNEAVKVLRALFGQTVPAKKGRPYVYSGVMGVGGKPYHDVKRVRRGLYEVSEEYAREVRRELEKLGVLHGFT